jgi:hypothetical protein
MIYKGVLCIILCWFCLSSIKLFQSYNGQPIPYVPVRRSSHSNKPYTWCSYKYFTKIKISGNSRRLNHINKSTSVYPKYTKLTIRDWYFKRKFSYRSSKSSRLLVCTSEPWKTVTNSIVSHWSSFSRWNS